MSAVLSRRFFLRGLLAAPFVAKAELLMPVRALALPPAFMPGDLVNFARDTWRETGIFAICEPVSRLEGDHAVFQHQYAPRGEYRVPLKFLSLFHGLPGNRVNNPSMRHRLMRVPDRLGLAYPEDVASVDSAALKTSGKEVSRAG